MPPARKQRITAFFFGTINKLGILITQFGHYEALHYAVGLVIRSWKFRASWSIRWRDIQPIIIVSNHGVRLLNLDNEILQYKMNHNVAINRHSLNP